MREELISLLEEAFDAGIITSSIQSQIDALKKNLKLNDAEYLQIEDQIRIDAYIHKVKEREKKGVTFMGDLRKQYKITEEDKIVIQEKLKAEPKKSMTETKMRESVKPSEAPKKQEQIKQPEPSKKQEPSKQSDVMQRSDLLKQHAQMTGTESTITQTVPKKQETPKKTEPIKQPESAKSSGEPPLILVADDNETQLFLTKKALEENGYTCITTDTPESAVRIITEKNPDLVLCDINFGIGKPTGLDVFTNIRVKKIMVPFVIVSAFIQKEFKDHGKRIGVTDYITKPTDYEDLIAIVKKYIVQK
jgi:CheY-like chemotaxis protein